MDIDTADYLTILFDEFDRPALFQDAGPDIWKTIPRWDNRIFNGPESYYADPRDVAPDGTRTGLDPFAINDGVLSIRAGAIPPDRLETVRDLLLDSGAPLEKVARVNSYAGYLSTHDSWAQTYGYFEIRAKMPRGSAHWPAFWLANATKGWPPEIDILEVFGKDQVRGAGNTYHATVHFDGIAVDGSAIDGGRIANSANAKGDAFGQPAAAEPVERARKAGPRWMLSRQITVPGDWPGDIFDSFHTYAVSWTPEEITWYFGPDAESMEVVYRSPTPPDVNSPLYVVVNDMIGGIVTANAEDGPSGDAMMIDYVKVLAPRPEGVVRAAGEVSGSSASEVLTASEGDDLILPGAGFDLIRTGDGADTIVIDDPRGNKILEDFGPSDTLVLEGVFRGDDVAKSLVQVKNDVWLLNPGTPFEPQTIILRDTSVEAIGKDQIIVR